MAIHDPLGCIECDVCGLVVDEVELVAFTGDTFGYDFDSLIEDYPDWRFFTDFSAWCPKCKDEIENGTDNQT